MNTGTGIAIAGIWIGVGLCGIGGAGGATAIVALCAFLATAAVVTAAA